MIRQSQAKFEFLQKLLGDYCRSFSRQDLAHKCHKWNSIVMGKIISCYEFATLN